MPYPRFGIFPMWSFMRQGIGVDIGPDYQRFQSARENRLRTDEALQVLQAEYSPEQLLQVLLSAVPAATDRVLITSDSPHPWVLGRHPEQPWTFFFKDVFGVIDAAKRETPPTQPAEGEKSAEEPTSSLTARRPEFALLRVCTNGVADERIRQASQILTDDSLTVNEKLTKIDGVMPLPLTASAEQLGAMLGVSKQAVMKTAWWREKRRGMTDEEIDRRQARLIDRGRKYERPPSEDDER